MWRAHLPLLSLLMTAALLASPVALAQDGSVELDLGAMGMGLFGGLALFLLGMDRLANGLKSAAGDRMRSLLERFTNDRISGAVTGAAVTAAIQSSSVTTVLVVGFVSAGLMTLTQSVGVIMGANVGTTLTAQIVAFKVEEYALALVAIGFVMRSVSRRDTVRHYGSVVLGLGLVFYGMGLMSGAMSPLRTYEPFVDLMRHMADVPVIAVAIGAAFTALVQSSSATTGIVVVMASEGLVSLPAGIALALGANLGTCVTAGLAAIGKPTEARRAATVHVIFNLFGALIWLPFLDLLADMARVVSPAFIELQGVDRLAAESPRQIANANTLFNLLNTIIFLFFAGTIAAAARWLVPERAPVEEAIITPEFLDPTLLKTPSFAIGAARRETARLGDLAATMTEQLRPAIESGDFTAIKQSGAEAKRSAALYRQIIDYISEISRADLTSADADRLQRTAMAASEFKSCNDLIAERLLPLVEKRFAKAASAPPPSPALIRMGELSRNAAAAAVNGVRHDDPEKAQQSLNAKPGIEAALADLTSVESASALGDDVAAFRRELEIGQVLRLSYSLSRRAAKAVLPRDSAVTDVD